MSHRSEARRLNRGFASAAVLVLALAVALTLHLTTAWGEGEPGASDSTAASGRVEIRGERTATSETYRLPDGSRETELFTSPINYRSSEGDWRPIDETLEEVAKGGITNAANSFDLHLPEELGSSPIRLSNDGSWISYDLLGTHTEEVEIEGSSATYESSGGGVAFELRSLSNGLKEEIVLNNSAAPSLYRFAFGLSADLTPIVRNDGSISIHDDAEHVFASVPPPVVKDGQETIADPDVAKYTLARVGEGWVLGVEVDPDWLGDAARRFPVRVDPTTYFAVSSLDCTIGSIPAPTGWSTCGTTPWTSPRELIAAYNQIEKQPIRTFVRFNLEGIPDNAYVKEATVSLYAPKAAENTAGLETLGVAKPWNQALNWREYNGGGPVFQWSTPGGDFSTEGKAEVLTKDRGSQAGWWDFKSESLRKLIGSEVAMLPHQEYSDNAGVVVKQTNETRTAECESSGICPRRFVAFNMSSAATNRPKLTVVYFPKAPATSKMTAPKQGTVTGRRLRLRAGWSPGSANPTGVSFQYRAGGKGPFENIPLQLIVDGGGKSPLAWPIPITEGTETAPYYFDAAHATPELREKGGSVQVRALFWGATGIEGYSAPIDTTVNRKLGGLKDATAMIGPGTLDLLTGNLNVSRTDVSIPSFNSSLTFSRTYNTREPGTTGDTSVLGQGWKANGAVEAAGSSAWRNIKVVQKSVEFEEETYTFQYVLVTSSQGYEIPFVKEGETYFAPPELSSWTLTSSGENRLALTDPSGTTTTFERQSGGSEYLPISVAESAGGSSRLFYQLVGGQRRLTMVTAPKPNGVTCGEAAPAQEGCRSLTFTYAPASNWGAPASYGDRLWKITFNAPGNGGPWVVAQYGYDSSGRLIEEWDPRISPNLKETYSYIEGSKLRTVKAPGLEPWTLKYTTSAIDGEGGIFRLKGVERATLLASPATATTSVRYEVPISGANAPYDLSGGAIEKWGQSDVPVDATAIYPPTEVPAEPATSYGKATIYYLDAEGFAVNIATPAGAGTSGASITTTETDQFGNMVRELSAQNRLRALADPEGKTAERSHQLATKRRYSADGTEMLEEWGPLHQIRLEAGTTTEARLHKVVQYDEGAPAGISPKPHLATRETTGANIPGSGEEVDQRETVRQYNWSLRKPTAAIIDPGSGHLNIKRTTVYDALNGLPVETRQPMNEGGGGAGTMKVMYYGFLGSDPECQAYPASVKWAGLPCKKMPASQPGSGPALPTTRFLSYSPLSQPTEILEEVPGAGQQGQRRTVLTYDTAGRQKSRQVIGGGQPISKVETLYSSSNGLSTGERFVCGGSETDCATFDSQAVSVNYDMLGRVTTYEDADGNKATTTYDFLGRPVSATDGKGSQTVQYDPMTGLPVELDDSGAGKFTASYDADGHLTRRGLPNGLTAETTYDPTGAAVHLTYTKATFCGGTCTWLDFDVEESIDGQILRETGTLGTDLYSYDKAGRLVSGQETPAGGGCTTRTYSYDQDSNRTSLTTRSSGIGGVCPNAGGTTQNYEYDSADRLMAGGLAYDNFGRTTALPAAYAGGKTLTASYFANDMVASQSQGGISNTFELDASLRQRSRLQAGGLEGTEVFHYDGPTDSPAWTQRGSTWTRHIFGITGELEGLQESGKEVELQLTNLHGDVSAVAAVSPEVTSLKTTYAFDEFGNPTSGDAGRFGWLGGKHRQTELASGVIQMGARSYVPQIGRFVSVDPLQGGSASAYDYANADPINNIDLDGEKAALGKAHAVRRPAMGLSSATSVSPGSSAPTAAAASSAPVAAASSAPTRLMEYLKRTASVVAPIAWGACVPLSEVGPDKQVVAAAFGTGGCIPPLHYHVTNAAELPAIKASAWAWCVATNAWARNPIRSSVSWFGMTLLAGIWCGGERAWAYVRVT